MIQHLCSLVFHPTESKTYVQTKKLHSDIYGCIIHNCQNLEAFKMSFNRWMDRQAVAYSDKGILSTLIKKKERKKNEQLSHEKTSKNFTCIRVTKWKKPFWKGTCCLILTIWHSGKGKIKRQLKKKISGCWDWNRVKDEQAEHRRFLRQ